LFLGIQSLFRSWSTSKFSMQFTAASYYKFIFKQVFALAIYPSSKRRFFCLFFFNIFSVWTLAPPVIFSKKEKTHKKLLKQTQPGVIYFDISEIYISE
jgi:hypothetical protein